MYAISHAIKNWKHSETLSFLFLEGSLHPRTVQIMTVNLLLLKLGLHWVSYQLIYLLLLFSTLSAYHSTHAVGEFRVISVGAGPAGPVLAGPLMWWFNEIHYRRIKNGVHAYYNRTTSKVFPTPLRVDMSYMQESCSALWLQSDYFHFTTWH